MKLTIFGILLLAAAVSAQKCCGSIQFMAGNGATVGQIDPSAGPQGFYIYQYGALDFYNRMFGYVMSIDYPNGTSYGVRVIQNFWEDKQWVIRDEEKYCQESKAIKPEPTNCIPNNATLKTTFSIGGTNGLWVEVWAYSFQRPKDPIDGNITVSVMANSCEPVAASFIGNRYDDSNKEIPYVSASMMINMPEGIPDRDKWFKIPGFCNQKENTISSRRHRSLSHLEALNMPAFF